MTNQTPATDGSLRRVLEAVWEVEEKYNLLEWKVLGEYLWVLMRTTAIRIANEKTGNYEPRMHSGHEPNPNIPNKLSENVIIKFVRTNPDGTDRFSQQISDSLSPNVQTLDFGHVKTFSKIFYMRYRYFAAALVLPFIRAKHRRQWAQIIEFLENKIQVDLSEIKKFPDRKLIIFKAERFGWFVMFKRSGTKRVFMVNAWNKPLLAGAQMAGAWFVEPQHGIFSKFHGLLSFPGAKKVPYYPNELFIWGQGWSEGSGIPESAIQTSIGHPKWEDFQRRTSFQPDSVLVLSQVFHSVKLLDWTRQAAANNPVLKFTYKLHPQEHIADFATEGLPSNLTIVSSEPSTLKMMRNSEFVIGVFSTGLLEAISIGCKTVVVKLPGWEHLEAFINKGLIGAVQPDEELNFSGLSFPPDSVDLFGQSVTNKWLRDHISRTP